MIHEWLLQSLIQYVPNVAAAWKRVLTSITGRPTERRIVKSVAKVHTGNSDQLLLMKIWWMGLVHVLTENSRGSFAPFLVANSNWQDFYSPKILSANGLSLDGHLPVSLLTYFWFFVSWIILWIGCTLVWCKFGNRLSIRINTASIGTLLKFWNNW